MCNVNWSREKAEILDKISAKAAEHQAQINEEAAKINVEAAGRRSIQEKKKFEAVKQLVIEKKKAQVTKRQAHAGKEKIEAAEN